MPAESRNEEPSVSASRSRRPFGGFSLVLRDRYLMLLALMVVLLNCINSTGEYILTDFVLRFADERMAAQPGLDKGNIIAAFYGDFFFAVNALTVFIQVFLVARILRWIGVHGALVILPVIAFIGYGLAVFLPIFGIIRLVKIFENSADYSLMNTTRQALYLPLPAAEKYEGKTAIDTFFWRFGDLLQAGVIFAGLHWFGFGYQQFAMLNMVLAGVWIAVAVAIGKRYAGRTSTAAQPAGAGQVVSWSLPRCPTPHAVGDALARALHRMLAPGRGFATMVMASLLGIVTLSVPAATKADISTLVADRGIFSDDEPLTMEFHMDMRALCRNPTRKGCEDVPATLIYRDADGRERRVQALVRSRGRWRSETGNCSFPALFVLFPDSTAGTLFDGETMLPLTTHCHKRSREHEQYVLKEYLAYRIYNLLTDKSLNVRLVRMTYHDTSRPRTEPFVRYGFFTEHFDSLAARHDAEVWKPEQFDVRTADPLEIATHDLFQYMIGNTDWSVIYGHNIVHIRDRAGLTTPVAYDFDFSGFVNARYAGPSPNLSNRSVTERVFRGFCRPDLNWDGLFARFETQEQHVFGLLEQTPDLELNHRTGLMNYLVEFFGVPGTPEPRTEAIVESCPHG